ncbi:PREDICTED: protein SIX6OS1 [Hipposideros armiger]|uniref:Protein SIX6OS1 n=1 Tax=Hipposideros armiger TaxID=186990 RepID=A0A8B7RKH0_HIPAR|nr:PREDICTED: protein SIX6OS1 [Hipposideros armiger]
MDDSLFVSLDRLLLEFVFQYEQDIRTKEDMIQLINKNFEDIKQNKAAISKIHEAINTTDEEIGHYCKHSKEIKDNCSNWKPTCDVFHKHEDYMQEQLAIYQETIEKDRKMYHGYVCQYKDVLKQYQLKYSETPLSHEYYEKKKEHEEIQNRMLACTEQLKLNETIFMELLVPAPFSSLTKWTLHLVNLRCKTQDILKHANNFSKISCELKKEVDELEKEINYLNQRITRLHETKTFSETLEEKNKEKRKELKESIFEKDEQHAHILNKTSQNSQLFLPYEFQKLIRPITMHSSESRVIGTVTCGEHFEMPRDNDEVEERAEDFPQTPEIPLFLRTPEAVKTPESLEKLVFPKTPSIEIWIFFLISSGIRNYILYAQFNEHNAAGNLNPLSSQQEIGNIFGKPEGEDAFTFSFSSDSSTHAFGAGKDDFSFPFSIE